MEKMLIVNADGFGFTKGINQGIIESVRHGIVRSTSALANMPAIEEVASFQHEFPHVSIGIHFNLSVGYPVSDPKEIPTLVDHEGKFWGKQFVSRLLAGKIKSKEMVKELDSQAQRLIDLGVTLTHFDGHQNKHLFPPFFLAALKVAKKYGIPCIRSHRRYLFLKQDSTSEVMRYYASHPKQLITHLGGRILTRYAQMRGFCAAHRLITPGYGDSTYKNFLDTWLLIMQRLPAGVNEIYCHPGYPDTELAKWAYYVQEREQEIKVLTSPKLMEAVEKHRVRLISFKDIIPR